MLEIAKSVSVTPSIAAARSNSRFCLELTRASILDCCGAAIDVPSASNTVRQIAVHVNIISSLCNPLRCTTALLPTSRGRVVERRPDNDFQYLDAISHKYTGKPFPFRTPEGRVALVIEIDKARYTKLPMEHTPAG